jgi:serine/threonine protein kinase/tetratricopeptide (TPR) repeat protein
MRLYNCDMKSGSRLGAYELIEELGAGGMGVVWRAHDSRLRRDVALKILPPHLAHDEALARFEREARGLAALSHPNIVSIFDLGQERELHYLVTELLDGRTLRDELRRGPIEWPKAVEWCSRIAEGLAAAHARGIVHRDLKPENIFLTSDSRVKILDFGLAKEISFSSPDTTTQAHHTEPGMVLGTLGYMSPEQLRGEESGFAADVFSLGCLLYEMISGKPAFLRGSTADTIAAILTSEPLPLTSMQAPAELSQMIRRCLAKKPAERFRSASELAVNLRELPLTTAPAEKIIENTSTRRWAIPVVSLLVVLALLAGFFLRSKREPAKVAAGKATARTMSLAVIPFQAAAEQSYAGEGLAESLFRRLALLDSVQVVSRREARAPLNVSGVGAEHVLRGTIRSAGDELLVGVEIDELSTGRRIWSHDYRGAASDLLTIQSRLGDDVEKFLREYSGAQRVARPMAVAATEDPEAYREYLKGRHYWNKFTIPGFTKALEHFQRSIDLDPTYALAYAGLADAYTLLGVYGGEMSEMMPKARAAAQQSLELDPQLGEGYTALGTVLYFYDWKFRDAEAALRRGLELNPRYASAHHRYAMYLATVGRSEEALREIQTASQLDPLSLVIYIDRAWILYARNEVDGALTEIAAAIRHDPRSPMARYDQAWYLEHAGRYGEAIDAYEVAMQLEGKETTALQGLRDALQSGGNAGYLRERLRLATVTKEPHTTLAAIYLLLSQRDQALTELEKAWQAHERDLVFLKVSPTYAALHAEPRFQSVLRNVGFP